MLMFVSLQNGELNQITFLFLFFSLSIWVIIIGVTYLDESTDPTTITPTFRAGVHWVHILQSTLESAVFEGFIIYPFALLKNFFT